MKKLLQCFWKNRISGKGSLVNLIIVVALSGMAVFGVINALPLLKIVIQDDMRSASYGNSDFIVKSMENPIFSLSKVKTQEKMIGMLQYYGILEVGQKKKCDILGGEFAVLPEVFEIEMENGEGLETAAEGAVITKWLADKMNLEKGDKISILINEQQQDFTVSGIALNKGLFKESTYLILVAKDKLDQVIGTSTDNVSQAYIYGCTPSVKKSDIIVSKDLSLTKVVDEQLIESEISMYSIFMLFILIFVFMIAFYIMYSTYSIFVLERSRYIGALRSCGASRRYIRKIFILANMFLTGLAGIAGILLGGAAVCVFAWKVIEINYLKTEAAYILFSAIAAILFCVILGIVSILMPLNQVLKFSERAQLSNEVIRGDSKGKRIPGTAFGITCILWIFTAFWHSDNLLVESVIFIIFIISSIVGIRFLLQLVDRMIGKKTGKGYTLIAVKNVLHNVYLKKNITIISILSILMIMVGSLSYSVLKGMSSFYNNYKCNVYFEASVPFDSDDLNKIEAIQGMNKYYPCLSKRMIVNNVDEVSCFIENNPEQFSNNFLEFNIKWGNFSQGQFSKGRYCIITDVLSKRYQLGAGDSIKIKRDGIEKEYQIAAICYSTIEKGNFIFISANNLPFDLETDSNLVLADCENIPDFLNSLEVTFADRKIYLTSVAEKVIADEENSTGLIGMFFAFSIFIILIGIQGIYHNFKLGYINRKRVFAVMISNGYRLKDIFQIVVIEAAACSLAGGIISLLYMTFYRKEIVNIMLLMDLALPLLYNMWIIFLPVLLCILASLLSISITSIQLKKLKTNLINILKI